MKIMDKLKNLFTDEVEEEIVAEIKEPVKKESIKVDIPAPAPKKEDDPIKTENMSLKKEEKFVFPVYFDENDFDDMEKTLEVKPKKIEHPKFEEHKKKEENFNNSSKKSISEKKIFKPTPIISPVYGILDKNYYKEDIVVTTATRSSYISNNGPMTVDDVRKKAFGTLEDDLEKTLFSIEPIMEEARHGKEDDSIFNELDFANAIEEDKKRDLSKNGLKADIESLLNDKEFESEFEYNIESENNLEDDADNNELSIEAILKEKNISEEDLPLEEDINGDIIGDINEEVIAGEEIDEDDSLENPDEDDEIIPYENDEVISDNQEVIEEDMTIGIENVSEDNNNEEQLDDITDGELDMPNNTSMNDNEIENAFADSSDLNDSDLFNLIDSMYDKEEE